MDAERLLGQIDLARDLSRALLLDHDRAHDPSQETWLVALVRPPRAGTITRPWLIAVARSLLRMQHRSERRRHRREQQSALHEALPATDALVAEEAMRREVVDAVFALEEPYRTTILLHYFEGATLRAIAAREDVPLETVRTRLKRGLARLRESLDRKHGGDRASWQMALAPFAFPAPWLAPAGVMPGALVAAVAAMLLIAGGATLWIRARSGTGTPPEVRTCR